MNIYSICLTVVLSLVAATSLAEDTADPIDALITQADLGNLGEADLAKLHSLISILLQGSAQSARTARLAENYFAAKGYKLLQIQLVSVEGTNWLVVAAPFWTSATSDLPLMFPSLTFQNGYYFCKTGIVGGITELIDMDGKSHNFIFASWKDLR